MACRKPTVCDQFGPFARQQPSIFFYLTRTLGPWALSSLAEQRRQESLSAGDRGGNSRALIVFDSRVERAISVKWRPLHSSIAA